jgi:hypothetical protein
VYKAHQYETNLPLGRLYIDLDVAETGTHEQLQQGCKSQNVSQPTGSASEGQQALLESFCHLAGHDEGAGAMEKEWRIKM